MQRIGPYEKGFVFIQRIGASGSGKSAFAGYYEMKQVIVSDRWAVSMTGIAPLETGVADFDLAADGVISQKNISEGFSCIIVHNQKTS